METTNDNFLNLTKSLRSKRDLVSGIGSKERQDFQRAIREERSHSESGRKLVPTFPIHSSTATSTMTMMMTKKSIIEPQQQSLHNTVNISHCPPLDLSNLSSLTSSSPSLASSSPLTTTISQCQKKKNLILSAGTVRERYRELRKNEEKKVTDRHSRNLKRHALMMKNSLDNDCDEKIEEHEGNEIIPVEEIVHEELKDIINEPSYPTNTVFISDLIYSKYCTDLGYKNETLSSIRKHLLAGFHVTLRSGSPNPSSSSSSIADPIFGDETLRESKQILRTLFVTCASLTSQDIPPPIEERKHRCGGIIFEMTLSPLMKIDS